MSHRLLPLVAAFLSLGALLAAPSPAQAKETPAYIAMGDSIAFGIGATDPATMGYAARAFDALRKSDRYRERGLQLINLSVPGATSSDLLLPDGQLKTALTEIEQRQKDTSSLHDDVEIISIDIGANDLLGLVAANSPCITQAADDKRCLQRLRDLLGSLRANLTEVLRRLRDAAPQATIVVVDLYNPYSGTGDIRETIADFGVAQVNGAIVAAASGPDLRVKTASVYQLFLGRGNQWVSADGIHPNDSGHTVISEVVLAAIEKRPPAVPPELLAATPGPIAGRPNADSAGGTDLLLLAAFTVVAFVAGALVSGAYFVVRGRSES